MDNRRNHDALEMTYEQFFEKYFHRLVDYCNIHSPSEDSEDIVMDAFATLWKHWNKLESHAEPVLFVWTKRAIALISKAHYRKRSKEPTFVEVSGQIDEIHPQAMPDTALSIEERVIENETYQQYLTEINKRLSPKERQLFDCIIIKEMSIRETAKHLAKTEKAISVGITRLREKLRCRILPEVLPKTSLCNR